MAFSHDIADYPDGIVLAVDKPWRWTSADVIRKLKYAAIRHFRKKNLKVGHAGTLDPLATGVLLVCIGPACKRAQELQDHDKEYVATIRFGATTPSYDLEKEVDRRYTYEHISEEVVREALKGFVGEQEQVAPLFSAKSVDGVRAYEMARRLYRSGRFSEIDAAALETLHRSRIVISDLELLDFRPAAGYGLLRPSASAPCESSVPATLPSCESPVPAAGYEPLRPSASPTPPIAGDGPLPLMRPGGGAPEKTCFFGVPQGVATGPASSYPAALASATGFSPGVGQNFFDKLGEKVLVRRGEGDAGAGTAGTASARIHYADTSELGLPEARVRIVCSKGTYIRAFARDLGEALGSGAHLAALERSRSGDFSISDALSVEDALSLFSF